MEKKFSPLTFLASLGAGGIAIIPFAFFQYTIHDGKGLITRSLLWSKEITNLNKYIYLSLESIMIIFTLIHFILTFFFLFKLVKWFKTDDFKEVIHDPLRNSVIITPFISILMTMNVFIGAIRYFFPIFF